MVSAAEFEAGYAERSGVTVDELHRWGLYAEPCDCGDDTCEGWRMAHTLAAPEPPALDDRLNFKKGDVIQINRADGESHTVRVTDVQKGEFGSVTLQTEPVDAG